MSYKERKGLYTIIENLDNLVIRDLAQLRPNLFYGFKLKYAKEMSDETFKKCLSEIFEVCRELNDIKSRLYLYSKMVKEME